MKEKTVNVRTRDMETHGMHSLDSLTARLQAEKSSRSLTSAFKVEGPRERVGNGIQPSNQEPVLAAAEAAAAAKSDKDQFDESRVN